MNPASDPAKQLFPWPGALTAVAVAGLVALGITGLWEPMAGRLGLERPAASLALALLGLGPTAFYALALERDKPAPALRSPLAPWILFCSLQLAVQLSGGPASPLQGAYPLFFLFIGRHAAWTHALALLALASVLQGLPLAQALREGGQPWPQALQLGLPWLGLAAGWGLRRPKAHPHAASGPGNPPAPAGSGLPFKAQAGLDASRQLQQELDAALKVVHDCLPGLDALTLWWGDGEAVRLAQGRLRSGRLAEGAVARPGESLLGLVLRDKRPLGVQPLAASAAAELPYRVEPEPVRCLQVLPLGDEGRLVGLLAADKREEEAFSPAELEALGGLARQAVYLAQRAAHLAQLQASEARTRQLYEAVQAMAADLDREALLQRFGELLQSLVPCDSWTLGLREGESGPLVRAASHRYLASAPTELSLEGSGALAASLGQAEGALLFNPGAGAQVPAALQEGLVVEAQHFLLAPLRLQGRLAGVLKLDRLREPFSEEDRELAFIFGNQAVGVLENARLFKLHQRLATTDGLTGLYNHRYFQERLALELEKAERSGKPLSLALTDIDHFKKFNDTFGHQEGDVVLRKVAHLVRDQVRQGRDIVARYGGEEFVVILPDCDIVEARQVMDALRAHCAATLIGGSGPEARAITLSIGLCSYPQGAKEQRELIHVADSALYKAKHEGRNQVRSHKDL